jgi:hypothetical protein
MVSNSRTAKLQQHLVASQEQLLVASLVGLAVEVAEVLVAEELSSRLKQAHSSSKALVNRQKVSRKS